MEDNFKNKSICILCGPSVFSSKGVIYTIFCFGNIIAELSKRFKKVNLCLPLSSKYSNKYDFALPDNVELIALPPITTAAGGAFNAKKFLNKFKKAIALSDFVIVRGALTPSVYSLYKFCKNNDKPIVHWLVGNPMELLKSHKRNNLIRDFIGKIYVFCWESIFKIAHFTYPRSFILSFGSEISKRFPSNRNKVIIGSPVSEKSFFPPKVKPIDLSHIKILCLCYMRPEKGIEYLLTAVTRLKVSGKITLFLVGGRDQYPRYQKTLDQIVSELPSHIEVVWAGHADKDEVVDYFDKSDIFVFPSLSEGAPYVLVEARAYGVPVVSTSVGGIPDSISNEYDGLLVAPKDAGNLAFSIERIILNENLRKKLILNGYKSVKDLSVESFVDKIVHIFSYI